MNKLLILLLILLGARGAVAQGTISFKVELSGVDEVPPNTSGFSAAATLLLKGNDLEYEIGWYLPFSATEAGIFGPAHVGETANRVFDLVSSGTPFFVPPDQFGRAGAGYSGKLSLGDSQKSDLIMGLFYINLSSATFPNGEIRGQIPAVPEPSTPVLLCLGLGVIGLGFWRKSS